LNAFKSNISKETTHAAIATIKQAYRVASKSEKLLFISIGLAATFWLIILDFVKLAVDLIKAADIQHPIKANLKKIKNYNIKNINSALREMQNWVSKQKNKIM
jgi:hypothetical protein